MLALDQLAVGASAIIQKLRLPESVEHHLMHMGFSPEARVVVVRRAPAGDPTVYAIDGMEIALRRDTAKNILVQLTSIQPAADARQRAGAKQATDGSRQRRMSLSFLRLGAKASA